MLTKYHQLNLPDLPIDDCMAELLEVLGNKKFAVLVAPPGAGKTTRVPLAILGQKWLKNQKIIMLEPRRLAARSAAYHLAELLGEKPGETIGYRVRMDSKVGKDTRLEIVTDGVFTRMILEDPELSGIGAVIFDEYHERSMDGDLGLALAIECADAFRPDLRILPMSATIDGAKVANLFDKTFGKNVSEKTPVITSLGRTFPVEILHQSKSPDARLEETMANAIKTTLRKTQGSLLCFLPGQGEIERVHQSLGPMPENVEVFKLYGALDHKEQSRAVRPAAGNKRKVILATSIAETSLTIDGVTTVIDSGLARVPVYEANTGLTRLKTVKASKASITQRAGRAGRTAPGLALRLWHEGQTGSLPDYERPEILEADLTALVLDLAQWGVFDPAQLRWLDEPPQKSWKEAKSLLLFLEAIDENGALTVHGKKIRALGLSPRLANMVVKAAEYGATPIAARLAMVLSERGLGGTGVDLSVRLENLSKDRSPRGKEANKHVERIVKQAVGHAGSTKSNSPRDPDISVGALLSFAWPERIAERMSDGPDGNTMFRLANGRRAKMDTATNLSKEKYIVVSDLQGAASSARIFGAASILEEEIKLHHVRSIIRERTAEFDQANDKVKIRSTEKIGSVILSAINAPISDTDDIPTLLIQQLREKGLEKTLASKSVSSFRTRAEFLHKIMPQEVPSFSLEELRRDLEYWLLPMIPGASSFKEIDSEKIIEGLKLRLGYSNIQKLDQAVPKTFMLPSRSSHALEYGENEVTLRARVQEFYGLNQHPSILDGKLPLTLEFLSPAMRPIQKTNDIVGFWRGSWSDVRKDMRGRYPKHYWPEDPASALATTRAKPRSEKSGTK